jgi:hypothetical protein
MPGLRHQYISGLPTSQQTALQGLVAAGREATPESIKETFTTIYENPVVLDASAAAVILSLV